MSFTTVKKELNKLDKDKLISLMAELYKKYPDVKTYLDFYAEPDEKALFRQYERQVHQAFFPVRGYNFDLRKGKKAISDFKKLQPSAELLAGLMLTYVEKGVAYTNEFGDIDEGFYSSIGRVYDDALQLMQKEKLLPIFSKRAAQVVTDTGDIGWGFHDYLSQVFYDHYPDAE